MQCRKTHRVQQSVVAVKVMLGDTLQDPYKEIDIHHRLSGSDYIVKFIGHFNAEDVRCDLANAAFAKHNLLLEWVDGKQLEQFLRDDNQVDNCMRSF